MLPEQPQPLNSADLARLDRFLHTAACGKEANEMLGLAMRLFREIQHSLSNESGYRPVFDTVRNPTGDTHTDAQHWCRGFVSGFCLFNERWSRSVRATLHVPLHLIFQLAEIRGLPDPVYAQLCDALPNAAEVVFRYWQIEGRQSQT